MFLKHDLKHVFTNIISKARLKPVTLADSKQSFSKYTATAYS